MYTCSRCSESKTKSEFYERFHDTPTKLLRKRVCRTCYTSAVMSRYRSQEAADRLLLRLRQRVRRTHGGEAASGLSLPLVERVLAKWDNRSAVSGGGDPLCIVRADPLRPAVDETNLVVVTWSEAHRLTKLTAKRDAADARTRWATVGATMAQLETIFGGAETTPGRAADVDLQPIPLPYAKLLPHNHGTILVQSWYNRSTILVLMVQSWYNPSTLITQTILVQILDQS
jgi:hypothetical protein